MTDMTTRQAPSPRTATDDRGPVPAVAGEFVARLSQLRATDVDRAGGKGANLGEMIWAGFPVPPGFVVLAASFRRAVAAARSHVVESNEQALAAARERASGETEDRLSEACLRLQADIRGAGMPLGVAESIRAEYTRLGSDTSVAVRSSAVGEDSADTSYAGMNATFTNVRGAEQVLEAVMECWASAFTPRVVAYRAEHGQDDLPAIAVVVQLMAPAEKAGVAFTADPVGGRLDRVVLEAAWGQGEVVVSGRTEPDTYVLDADGPRLLEVHRGSQSQKIVAAPGGGDRLLPIGTAEAGQVLSREEADDIAALVLRVQAHFGCPQDVEWVLTDGSLSLVQTRPITTLAGAAGPPAAEESRPVGEPLLHGLAASPGRATGRVRVPDRVPTTAGTPSSRATIAAWQVTPPVSVTRAAALRTAGIQSGLVSGATSTSPLSRRLPSAGEWRTRTRPVARPGDAARPRRTGAVADSAAGCSTSSGALLVGPMSASDRVVIGRVWTRNSWPPEITHSRSWGRP